MTTSDPPRRRYRAALIGCGSMGSYIMDELVGLRSRTLLPYGHAEVLLQHPATELVAGADPSAERLSDFGRRWGVSRLYQDHREMLERERPEIVAIASPPNLHAAHTIDAARSGALGIFGEKPLAPTLREADALVAACDELGVRLAINHTRRGDPFMHRARELVAAGEIGSLLSIVVTWAGRLFLTGTHSFDIANFLNGDTPTAWLSGHAEEPTAEMTPIPTQRGEDVGGTAYVVYRNGVRAFFNGRDGGPTFRVELFGTHGMIVLDDQEAQLWRRNETSPYRELLKHPFPQMMVYTSPMMWLLGDLIGAIEGGREPASNGRTARHALQQILATHRSSETGNGRVDFPFEDPDARTPFRWFGEGGQVVYRAVNPGARD